MLGPVEGFQGDEGWTWDYDKGKERVFWASFLQIFLQVADGCAALKASGKSIE